MFSGSPSRMYWGDHGPPHFHARYGGEKASIAIEDLSVLAGSLPPRALGLVVEWAALHRGELEVAWRKASRNETLDPIEPLK
ncbi:MAG: DUF4160 domain-containing protein [Gemmatimonadetes bacterium]|nr:DUF4160 domain-containing protein [Gemmatimonadota bacterium]